MSNTKSRYYPTLDLWKYICSILVLVIHTFPFSFNYWLDGAAGVITRFANPSFFTISGFLLFGRVIQSPENAEKTVAKQIKRILILYMIWSVFYYLLLLPQNIENGNAKDVTYWLNTFFLKGSVHYFWFFPALIVGIIITYMLYKLKLSTKKILIIGAAVLFIGCMISTYKSLFMGIPAFKTVYNNLLKYITAKNGLFFGFPYIALGYYLADRNSKQESSKETRAINRYLIGTVVFMGVLGCESLLVSKKLHPNETYLWISVFPMIFCMISWLISCPLMKNKDFRLLGKISSFTYAFQYIPITLTNNLFDKMGFDAWYRGILLLIICIVMCNLAALIVIKLSEKIKLLKYIY